MSGKTIIEKILSAHSGEDAWAGDRVWAELDLAVVRDFGGPNVVLEYEKQLDDKPVWDPQKIAMTFDYQAPAKVVQVANNQRICREFAEKHGIPHVFDVNAGIGQHVLLEHGMVLPGSVIIGTDSHMNLLGAVGSFSTGMGTTDVAAGWATGRLWFRVPETIKVTFKGEYRYPASAKDLTLFLLSRVDMTKTIYKSLEFYGQPIDSLTPAGRLTLASMVTEMEGKIGFIIPDKALLAWIGQRAGRTVEAVVPDRDASYWAEWEYDLSGLEPLIACPDRPDNVKPVREVVGTHVDEVFIGSCTNGRLEDLRVAAEVLERMGGKIAPHVRLVVTPATTEVAMEALGAGLYETFVRAGAMVTNQGCSLCTIGHHGVLAEGDVLVSTGNRNFRGKLGKGSAAYLASPAVAAATAVKGEIALPE
ncbi:MAG: aconitase/3-isopropylmalate dehydratase large subunit family protein [Anaerolineae bacterium]|nr:aconitase/3-isopropylmalate dehydratase large subunit family protein [Anaerolineae bacterium]